MEAISIDPLALSASFTYRDARNCLVVKRWGRFHLFLAHIEYLVGNGLEAAAPQPEDMELVLFVP